MLVLLMANLASPSKIPCILHDISGEIFKDENLPEEN